MFYHHPIVVLLLLTLPISTLPTTTPVRLPTLPYEFHSFNDIDSWNNVIASGTRWFKLDIGPCTQASCEQYSTFGRTDLPYGYRGNRSDCVTDTDGEIYCCICMRGDASTRPYLLDPFNTTWDLAAWINSQPTVVPVRTTDISVTGDSKSNQNPHQYTPNVFPIPRDVLRMGLDYGGNPNCDGGLASGTCTLFPLISQSLLSIYTAINQSNLAIEPYFDDVLNGWFQDLDSQCAPASPTRHTCTTLQLELQAIPWKAETSPPFPSSSQDIANRFGIPNAGWTSLPDDCASGTGWWENDNTDNRAGTNTPYLWWEQENQIDFWTLLNNWTQCGNQNVLPSEKVDVRTGMVAVSNVGPAMFEVFTSSLTNRGLNNQFTTNNLLVPSPSDLHYPMLLVIPSNQTGTDRWTILATSNSTHTNIYTFATVDGQAPTGSLKDYTSILTLPFTGPLSSFTTIYTEMNTYVFMDVSNTSIALMTSDYNGNLGIISVSTVNGSLTLVSTAVVPSPVVPGTNGAVLGTSTLCLSTSVSFTTLPSICIVTLLVADTSITSPVLNVVAINYAQPNNILSSATVQNTYSIDTGASIVLYTTASGSSTSNEINVEGYIVYGSSDGTNNITTRPSMTTAATDSTGRRNSPSNRSYRGATQAAEHVLSSRTNFPYSVPIDSRSSSYVPKVGIRSELFSSIVQMTIIPSNPLPSLVNLTIQRFGSIDDTPVRIGFGSRPSLSFLISSSSNTTTTSIHILLLNTDGNCDCGLLLNNADFSRCELNNPLVDWNPGYNLFQSVNYQLTYSYGTVEDWYKLALRISNGNTARPSIPGTAARNTRLLQPLLTILTSSTSSIRAAPVEYWDPSLALGACHPSLTYGKFELGSSVSGNLYPWFVLHPSARLSNGTEIFNGSLPVQEITLLIVHDGDIWDSLQSDILCGMPVPKSGLVWDSFRLPQ